MKKIKISVKLSPNHSREDIKSAAEKEISALVCDMKILRKSVDARNKNDIKVLYTVVALVEGRYKNTKNVSAFEDAPPLYIPKKSSKERPVVIGCGPAGLFAAYILASSGLRPIVLERGKKVDERKCDIDAFNKSGILNPSSNVQFGEGGAGTFSDGKLSTGIKSAYIKTVLEVFHKMGAPEEIIYDAKPHIGSDKLVSVVRNLRCEIEKMGGEFYFKTTAKDIKIKDGRVCSVVADTESGEAEFCTDTLFLAIGHSARDTFYMLYDKGVTMEAKPFSVGARIEHLQSDIDRAQYGARGRYGVLGAADYKLSCHLDGGYSVYTFCMCPGGYVSAAASEEGGIVTNGYSNFARDNINANSAVLVGITPEKYGGGVLGGIEYQRKIERAAYNISGTYKAPCQLFGDLMKGRETTCFGSVKPTYEAGVIPSDISYCLPQDICTALCQGILEFDKKIKGFASPDALLTAPEVRSSSPVRIKRDESGQSNIKGLYPIGEGSGYAGGITSSAVDGIKSVMNFIKAL